MWQPRSLAGHRDAGKESSSMSSLCGCPPGIKETQLQSFLLGIMAMATRALKQKGLFSAKMSLLHPAASNVVPVPLTLD